MANVYVRSGAGGAGTGADWTNAYLKLSTAFAAKAAGDNFWLADDHAESEGAAITLTCPGTVIAPCTVICVNRAGTVPPVSADLRTTAVIACGAGAFQLQFANGNTYWYGVTFKSGTGATDWGILHNGTGYNYFKNCVFWKPGTNAASSAIEIFGSLSSGDWGTVLDNTSLRLGSTDDSICLGNRLVWKNTATPIITTEAVPTALFNYRAFSNVVMNGLDFSGCASTSFFNTNIGIGNFELRNVKLHASTSLSILGTVAGRELNVIDTDSSSTNYRSERHDYYADQTTETTIVRTGGASDGVTTIAWKIITGANTKWVRPFVCIPMSIKNNTTGSNVTVTVFGVWGGGAVPNNDEIAMEVHYMGSSGSPVATINTANEKADFLASATAQAADSSTWGGSTTKFKMSVTLSAPQPAMRGPIYVIVKVYKPSSTFYVDPKIVLT